MQRCFISTGWKFCPSSSSFNGRSLFSVPVLPQGLYQPELPPLALSGKSSPPSLPFRRLRELRSQVALRRLGRQQTGFKLHTYTVFTAPLLFSLHCKPQCVPKPCSPALSCPQLSVMSEENSIRRQFEQRRHGKQHVDRAPPPPPPPLPSSSTSSRRRLPHLPNYGESGGGGADDDDDDDKEGDDGGGGAATVAARVGSRRVVRMVVAAAKFVPVTPERGEITTFLSFRLLSPKNQTRKSS